MYLFILLDEKRRRPDSEPRHRCGVVPAAAGFTTQVAEEFVCPTELVSLKKPETQKQSGFVFFFKGNWCWSLIFTDISSLFPIHTSRLPIKLNQ